VTGGRHDLHDVSVLESIPEWHHLAVDPSAYALVADVGVDGVGEINGSRASWKRLDLPLGREEVDFFGIQIQLQAVEKLVRILDLALPVDDLAKPCEVADVFFFNGAAALFVAPMCRDTFLGDLMHFWCANLDLERDSGFSNDTRVK
jgi:hypothetical protein